MRPQIRVYEICAQRCAGVARYPASRPHFGISLAEKLRVDYTTSMQAHNKAKQKNSTGSSAKKVMNRFHLHQQDIRAYLATTSFVKAKVFEPLLGFALAQSEAFPCWLFLFLFSAYLLFNIIPENLRFYDRGFACLGRLSQASVTADY
jgi:hypothetical protein